jgi:hypothetical protein
VQSWAGMLSLLRKRFLMYMVRLLSFKRVNRSIYAISIL